MNTIRLMLPRGAFTLDVDLTLPQRGITAIFGVSGSGKTTLLRCVAGLEPDAKGEVRIAGESWQDDAARVRLPTWQRPLGYVFQEASLFDHLDVRGNIAFGERRANTEGHAASARVIELLGIGDLLQRRPHELSGGERQRVAIARAVATRPRILLLDEPLAALDAARRREVLPWLERLRDDLGIPMLYVSHSADEVARLADTLVVMQAGRVAAHGPLRDVLARIDLPITLGADAGAILEGVVDEIDRRWSLARMSFAGGSVWLADAGLRTGQRIRVRVLARDVSIAAQQPSPTSIQNLLACTVRAIAPGEHASQALVQLACGDALLVARITARGAHELSLETGQPVWAQVKSVALVD